jgi:hypothetical protein
MHDEHHWMFCQDRRGHPWISNHQFAVCSSLWVVSSQSSLSPPQSSPSSEIIQRERVLRKLLTFYLYYNMKLNSVTINQSLIRQSSHFVFWSSKHLKFGRLDPFWIFMLISWYFLRNHNCWHLRDMISVIPRKIIVINKLFFLQP